MSIELLGLDGHSRIVVLLGDPIAQVRAPAMVTERFGAAGANMLVVAMRAAPADFDAVVAALKRVANVVGFIFTVPHKMAAMAHADALTDAGRLAGALNVLRREADGTWRGGMMDGEGFVAGLLADGARVRGARVLLVGAGGVGSAIGVGLVGAGAGRIDIFDIDGARAQRLAGRLAGLGATEVRLAAAADPEGADIVVNATPLGMAPGDALPVDPARLSPSTFVAEVIMKPAETPLLAAARGLGCPTAPGENVIRYQMEPVSAFFLGAARGDGIES